MTASVGQVVRQLLLLLCYYNYQIRRAVNIMSVLLKRRASKLMHLEALYHQSLRHRSHTPYQASTHKDTLELLVWDTPSKELLHSRDTKVGHITQTCPYSGERDTFPVSQNPGLTSIQGTP